MNRAVDFARSSCTWLLDAPRSYGRFSLDAVIAIGEEGEAGFEQFVLCAQVFACDVYADGDLFMDPPYGYAAAFSASRYRIFRDPTRAGQRCEDTIGRVPERFQELRMNVAREQCQTIEPGRLVQEFAAQDAPLSARLVFPRDEKRPRVALEFPVRHVNVDPKGRRFQVETGPVLMLDDFTGEPAACLRRAYVAFGRADRAEFLIDTPRNGAATDRWARSFRNACEISFLRVDG